MVGDAVVRHVVFVVEAHEGVHRGAVAGHVVGPDGAAVVRHCEVVDPFLVDRRRFWEGRVAERVAEGGLFFLGVEVGTGVGVSAGDEKSQCAINHLCPGGSIGSIQDEYILHVGPPVPVGCGSDARGSLGEVRGQAVIGEQEPEDAERDQNGQEAQDPARQGKGRVAKGSIYVLGEVVVIHVMGAVELLGNIHTAPSDEKAGRESMFMKMTEKGQRCSERKKSPPPPSFALSALQPLTCPSWNSTAAAATINCKPTYCGIIRVSDNLSSNFNNNNNDVHFQHIIECD